MTGIIERLANEMTEWVTGARSHTNEFMRCETSPDRRQETLVNIARADAVEVDRLRAAIQAEIALDQHYAQRRTRAEGNADG